MKSKQKEPSPKFVAMVPMRHNSERVRGKNYRPFAGKPLYQGTARDRRGTRGRPAAHGLEPRVLGTPQTQPDQVFWTFVADDDDGVIQNGTPNYEHFCL